MITLMLKERPDIRGYFNVIPNSLLAIGISRKYYAEVETTWFDEQDFFIKNKEDLLIKFCDLYDKAIINIVLGPETEAYAESIKNLFEDFINKEYKKNNNHNDFKEIVL